MALGALRVEAAVPALYRLIDHRGEALRLRAARWLDLKTVDLRWVAALALLNIERPGPEQLGRWLMGPQVPLQRVARQVIEIREDPSRYSHFLDQLELVGDSFEMWMIYFIYLREGGPKVP